MAVDPAGAEGKKQSQIIDPSSGMSMIDTVLFDCWGTLLHAPGLMTRGATMEYFFNSLKSNGLDIDYEAFKEKYAEIAKRQHEDAMEDQRELDYVHRLDSTLSAMGLDDHDRSDLARKVWLDYLLEWPKQSNLYAETPNLLSSLQGRYRLGLVTNFPDGPTARMVFEKFNFDSFFDSIVVSGEVGFRKPNRLLFDLALHELGSAAEFSVMVGDTFDADVLGAKGAGIKAILVDVDCDKVENYEKSDAIVKSIGEVEKILNSL